MDSITYDNSQSTQNVDQKSDSILETSKNNEKPQVDKRKTQLCQFYIRGICIYSSIECKFAHGISELKFQKIESKISHNDLKKVENLKESKTEKKKHHMRFFEILDYKILFEVNIELYQEGLLDRIYTKEEINNQSSIRKEIRSKFYPRMAKQFIELLYNIYQTHYLTRDFIDLCFNAINWNINWGANLDSRYFYEAKIKEDCKYIVRLPAPQVLDNIIQNNIIKIIYDNKFMDNLPISPSLITKYYYKDLMKDDPLMPNLSVFFKSNGDTLDRYLQKLQKDEGFLAKMMEKFQMKNFNGITIFGTTSNEIKRLNDKILNIIIESLKKSDLGIVIYFDVEVRIMDECRQEITQLNYTSQIKKTIKKIALENKALIINLVSTVILFSIEYFCMNNISQKDMIFFGSKNCQRMEINLEKQINIKNSNNHLSMNTIASNIPLNYEKYHGDIDSEINFDKIIIVDDFETLKIAKEYFKLVTEVGVDLEGQMNKDGFIELIQFSTKEKIFVFDIYKISIKSYDCQDSQKENEINNNIDLYSSSLLYKEMKEIIKWIMENPKIIKIFHDCRKDSLVLHKGLNICLKNVLDIGALYAFSEHLQKYMKFDEKIGLSVHLDKINYSKSNPFPKSINLSYDDLNEITKCIEEFKPPGLNDILEEYQASHGSHNLKKLMKNRFGVFPREYFLQRPIDKEFLVYSARDVEDLLEIKDKILEKLKIIFSNIIPKIDQNKFLLLMHYISGTYSSCGCF